MSDHLSLLGFLVRNPGHDAVLFFAAFAAEALTVVGAVRNVVADDGVCIYVTVLPGAQLRLALGWVVVRAGSPDSTGRAFADFLVI